MTQPTQSGLTPPTGAATDPYAQLEALGIQLPKAFPPVANFINAVEVDDLVFVSGQGPRDINGKVYTGKVGADVSVTEAYQHARVTAINLLAILEQHLGDLRRVRRVVKVLGMVNAAADFTHHPEVINGCSDLLVEVFGPDIGRHARSAVGMGSLPRQITVEIEMIVAVRPA